jgi:hypothetical protein
MDLPNAAIPEIEIDFIKEYKNGAATEITSLYTATFTDSSNAGEQNTLECNLVSTNDVDGAQPKYDAVALCKVFNVGGPEWFEDSGTEIQLDLKLHGFVDVNEVLKQADVLGGAVSTVGTTYEDFQPCSAKGDCDAATGSCTCNSGHYGEACEKQSTYY